MWIVKLALARPYTFIVLSLVLLLICPVAQSQQVRALVDSLKEQADSQVFL